MDLSVPKDKAHAIAWIKLLCSRMGQQFGQHVIAVPPSDLSARDRKLLPAEYTDEVRLGILEQLGRASRPIVASMAIRGRAKWWQWHNGGWVHLSIHPGDTFTFRTSHRHDEGYHREEETFEYRFGQISRTVDTDGRDCDGRMSTHTELYCYLCDLDKNESARDGETPVRIPSWQRDASHCHQRDYAAEAAMIEGKEDGDEG